MPLPKTAAAAMRLALAAAAQAVPFGPQEFTTFPGVESAEPRVAFVDDLAIVFDDERIGFFDGQGNWSTFELEQTAGEEVAS